MNNLASSNRVPDSPTAQLLSARTIPTELETRKKGAAECTRTAADLQ